MQLLIVKVKSKKTDLEQQIIHTQKLTDTLLCIFVVRINNYNSLIFTTNVTHVTSARLFIIIK